RCTNQSHLRRARRAAPTDDRRATGAGRKVAFARRTVDPCRDDPKDRLRPALELSGQSCGVGTGGIHRRRPAALGAARRPPERRGDPALARRAARGRAPVGGPSTASRLTRRSITPLFDACYVFAGSEEANAKAASTQPARPSS